MVGLFDDAVTAAIDYDTAGMNRVPQSSANRPES
jgi:hypothetical protein